MARIESDPNYSTPTFPRATASTDLFKKEDVQALAAAMSTHDHTTGKGAVLVAGSIPAGSITSGMIADGTIVAGDIADGAVTSAKILDGTIATADLANNAVTNAKLASDTARANLLTNGGFEIWQRGNGPFTLNTYSADRWIAYMAGSSTLSVSRDSANADGASQYCAALTYVHNAASLWYQSFADGGLAYQLRGKSVSFSLRVRASVANAVRLSFNDGTTTYGSYHSGGGTYETLTITKVIGAGATGINVQVSLEASGTYYIDNAMLVVGGVAADYAPLHPADDLARCQRYYEAVVNGIAGAFIIRGYGASAAIQIGQSYAYKCSKAVVPTLTVQPAAWAMTNASGPTIGAIGQECADIFVTSSAAGHVTGYPSVAGAGFVIEGNP
jgi:hypothetical protein